MEDTLKDIIAGIAMCAFLTGVGFWLGVFAP